MSSNDPGFDIVTVGFDQVLTDQLLPLLSPLRTKTLSSGAEVEGFLEGYSLSPETYVLISTNIAEMQPIEIAQALSSCFHGINLVFITADRTKFEIKTLKKNGFTESFLLPLDREMLATCIEDIKQKKSGGGMKRYKAVKLMDIQAGQSLPFAVRTYMPMNKKYALISASGTISDKKLDLLKQKSVNSVFISTEEIDKFYEFSAEQLISLGEVSNDGVSQTEKAERFKHTVRELFRAILDSSLATGDFEAGKDLMDQSKKVVESYVLKKTGLDLKAKILSLAGEGADSYSHAQSVSSIACLLSMATKVGEPEDLAIAGLFHDIGKEGVRDDISILDYPNLSAEDKQVFAKHPRASLNLLKEKRITVTPRIAEIIEKHHERIDGTGFPAHLPAHKIPLEAQLLAYTDAFEHLTRPIPGRAALPIEQVHQTILERLGLAPELLERIKSFLVTTTETPAAP